MGERMSSTWIGMLAGALLGAVAALGVTARADLGDVSTAFLASGDDLVALGAGFAPDYEGAGDSGIVPAVYAHVGLGEGRFVELIGTALRANFIGASRWQVGPVVNYRPGRQDADDATVRAVHEVDDAWEAGLALGWQIHDPENARNRLRVGLDLLQDVSDGHGGFVADLSVIYRQEVAGRLDLGVLAGVSFASGDYMAETFGVTAADATASGLSAFQPDGGFRDIRIAPLAVLHLSENWRLGAVAGWRRLIGDAADSPVVKDRGDENQFYASMTMAYAW
ncbi:MipA/OmpV family protein [Zavarzinia compransoris]|uniref:MipA/OmpV family protein n=1 Tax=Zavarzinia marina TaxID=2911065 RepID=UPI001F3C6DAA|nr:MipA/OmpV family protein [Zavarzinia marina]MCF4166432.1 MipA/OmpV family protein [Zavarzinia marina]